MPINNVNTFVGTMTTDKRFFLHTYSEDLYMTHLLCYGAEIPIVVPECFIQAYAGKRVKVMGFPRRTHMKLDGERQVFSYLSCPHVEATDEQQDMRYVEIEGTVVSCSGLRLGEENLSRIRFELECCVNFDKPVRVLVPCRAFASNARKLLNLEKGDYLRVKGYISGSGQTLRVVVRKFERGECTTDADN